MVTEVDDQEFADGSSTQMSGIHFNDDGTKMFLLYQGGSHGDDHMYINQYNLSTPYDISTGTYAGDSARCYLDYGDGTGSGTNRIFDLEFSSDGLKLFTVYGSANNVGGADLDGIYRFDLTSAYDISTCSFAQTTTDLDSDDLQDGSLAGDRDGDTDAKQQKRNRSHGINFNEDGTKVFISYKGTEADTSAGRILEYNLSTPYDVTTLTLNTNAGIRIGSGTNNYMTMTFGLNGKRIFMVDHNADYTVTQITIGSSFDLSSSSTTDGTVNLNTLTSSNVSQPRGIAFSASGLKMFITVDSSGGRSSEDVFEYDLACPFNIISGSCPSITENSDRTGIAEAQIMIAKRTIDHSTKSALHRLEWIRRNKDNQNLTNLDNFNTAIISDNPMLNYWVKKFPDKLVAVNEAVEGGRSITIGREYKKGNKNSNNLDNFNTAIKSDNPLLNSWLNKLPEKIYSQVSLGEKKTIKTKNKNWSYWSHGDISFGRKGDTATSKPKEIRVSGLMFGADKKINNNKFVGAAIRFGKGEIENISPGGIELDTESLTLNLYSTLSIYNNSNLNALFGVSLLRIDQLLSNEITGERNGKQVFTAFNLESKDSYGNFNIRPTGKFEFGVTQFSEYTDFGTSSTNSQDTYDSLTFKTGNIAAGFKFDNFIDINDGKLNRNGSLEYIQDLTSNIDYNFKNNSDNVSVTKTAETHSINNIKGNLGFEILYESGYTFALNYERFQGLDYSSHQDSIFFKFGHIREEDSEFAFNYKPLQNNQMELSYVKDVNGFDITFGSNYTLMSAIPDYGARLEISNKF